MRNNDIKAKAKKRWKITTKATKDPSKTAPNLVNQNFIVKEKKLSLGFRYYLYRHK